MQKMDYLDVDCIMGRVDIFHDSSMVVNGTVCLFVLPNIEYLNFIHLFVGRLENTFKLIQEFLYYNSIVMDIFVA